MAYTTVAELARVLKLPSPTVAQTDALQQVLDAAAEEIDWWLDGPVAAPTPALVVEVNLERAVEHWKQRESSFGIVSVNPDVPPVVSGANSFRRHEIKLMPLKTSWGVA